MSNALIRYLGQWHTGWNRFWFTPADPATVCLLRILVGYMLVYTHVVWTLELPTFFSAGGILSSEYSAAYRGGSPFGWSHFDWSGSAIWMWGTHAAGILVLVAFAVGLWTRVTGILAFLIVVSYAHRAGGALFGLDQINTFLTLYLAIAPCGAMYSVDAWLARRRSGRPSGEGQGDSTTAAIAIRLMQVHLCVVYLFAGLGKLQGAAWWDGTAIWGAFASYEYQTVDMTWLVHLPWAINLITLASVFWEVSYPFLVWPRLTRPLCLAMAVLVHVGIGPVHGHADVRVYHGGGQHGLSGTRAGAAAHDPAGNDVARADPADASRANMRGMRETWSDSQCVT